MNLRDAILTRTDLQALAEEAGARFNPQLSSCCPLHGGDNPRAFHLFRGQDGYMRWHCFTNCPPDANRGNALDFYMQWQHVDFKTALAALAARAGLPPGAAPPAPAPPRPVAPAKPPTKVQPPPLAWQHRARAFVTYAQEQLMHHPAAQAYLQQRGLDPATCRIWQLGYNPQGIYDRADKWGLADRQRLYCAPGIVIPHFYQDYPWFVNIRQLHQTPKYLSVRGGRRGMLFGTQHQQGYPLVVLCEGEFDAILAWQAAGDLCDVLALGGAQNQPAAAALIHLCQARTILAILDTDRAGQQGNRALQRLSARITPLTPPTHDLTDYWQQGGNLRYWLAQYSQPHLAQILETAGKVSTAQYLTWLAQYEQMLALTESPCL